MKNRILVVGDYNREDFLLPFKNVKDEIDLFFIEFISKKEINSNHKMYGKAIFWKDYSDAYHLLKTINPAKVIFYFIETYNHVALNVAAKALGIKTFHLEHGIRNYEISKKISSTLINTKQIFNYNNFNPLSIYCRLKNRLFFANTVKNSSIDDQKRLNQYRQVRSINSIFETFIQIKSNYRIADEYISFCPEIFKFHQLNDNLPANYPVTFIGMPNFDKFSNLTLLGDLSDDIIFIDQCLPEQGLLGWNEECRLNMVKEINDLILLPKKIKMYVKIHPLSDLNVWELISEKYDNIVLIRDEENFLAKLSECRIILGFNSTMLLPLIVQKHTICFSLENHPNKMKYSHFLTETRAIDEILNVQNLSKVFDNLDEVMNKQITFKKEFEGNWLFKFDGLANDRLDKLMLA